MVPTGYGNMTTPALSAIAGFLEELLNAKKMAPICMSAQEMNCVEQVISLLNNCKNLNSFRPIHAHATKLGLDSDRFIAGKLILHCAVNLSDATHYARLLLHHQPNPDAFMYNAIIRGHSDSNSPQNSISIFKLMIKNSNLRPDSFSFAFTLKAAANLQCVRTGSQLHCQALTRGFNTHLFVATTLISMYAECGHVLFSKNVFDEIPDPNVVTWNAMLTAFIRCNDIIRAERVFNFMPAKGLDSYNVMLAGYTKTGELKKAMMLFTEMPMRDEVSWSTIIVGCAQNGLLNEAFGLFRELRRMETRPNETSLTGVLSACAQAGDLRFANILHGFIIKVGLLYITSLNNAFIDTYSKCGSVNMACLVFDRMLSGKDVVTWTSMLAGLAMQGYGEEAISLFHEMEKCGIKPDGIAFITILYACSHAGLVEQGCEIFDKMKSVYAVEPTVEHYGCMVDLYSRAGELQKAYDFILNMPIPPNGVVWRTLLGACSFWGDVKLAEVVKESLSKIDPNDYRDHVLLSNIYALAGKWKEVANARTSMAEMEMKKFPAWSMIELGKFNREIT